MPDRYGTAAGFTLYHLARNRDVTVGTEDDVEAALLVASEWLDARFRLQYPGAKAGGRDQAREWERTGAADIYDQPLIGIPREIEWATYEIAAIQMASPGLLSVNYTPGKYQSVFIAGALSVTYSSVSSIHDVQTQFMVVNEVLSTILSNVDTPVSYVGSSRR